MRTFAKSRGFAFVSGAAVAATAFILAGADIHIDQAPVPIDEEPVLFWDIAGYGLGGPIHERLAVYSDGLVTYAYGGAGGRGSDDGAACFQYVPPKVVSDLAAALRAAGAFQAVDDPYIALDTPITTATVFRPTGNGTSRAKTFNFSTPGSYIAQQVNLIVQDFKSTYLPGGVCDGSG